MPFDEAQRRRLTEAAFEAPCVFANGFLVARLMPGGMIRISFAEENAAKTRFSPRGGVLLNAEDAQSLGQMLLQLIP